MTVRSTSPWYRVLLLFQKGFHYVSTSIAAVFSFLSPVIFPLMGCGLIALSLWFFSQYSVGLAVGVGDNVVGYVRNSAQYSAINDQVETRVKQESVAATGKETYLVEAFPTLRYTIVKNDEFTSDEDLFEELYTMASEYTRRSFGLFVDGELIATSKDRSVLDSILEQVLAYYVMDAEADNLEILNYVEIIKGEYSASYDLGYARILDLFKTGPSLKTYTVVKGDTLASLSEKSGISVPVLRLLNDIPVGRDVFVGQTLYYGKPYLQLTVKNTLTVTSAETVPFETEYTYSKEYFEGTKKVLSPGSEGIYEVVSNNVYVNGQASSTMEVSRTKIKDPVTQKVLIGTKTIAPSGKFIFPLKKYHYISSRFGWRWLLGQYSFHNAIDISASTGTPILAADAGTVQKCGWDNSLGWFVEIDHGNGIVSIYGHASSLAKGLYTGKKVYQGEVISYVGSTGFSTGPHLHFSLYHKAKKQYLDPEKYF